jgi:hypothetical protein
MNCNPWTIIKDFSYVNHAEDSKHIIGKVSFSVRNTKERIHFSYIIPNLMTHRIAKDKKMQKLLCLLKKKKKKILKNSNFDKAEIDSRLNLKLQFQVAYFNIMLK